MKRKIIDSISENLTDSDLESTDQHEYFSALSETHVIIYQTCAIYDGRVLTIYDLDIGITECRLQLLRRC